MEKFLTFHELCSFSTGVADLQSSQEDNCSVGLGTNLVLFCFLPNYLTLSQCDWQFPFEHQKGIGFASAKPHDWVKNLVPLFHPVRKKSKPILTHWHSFSGTLHQLHVITSSFDWFTVLSVSSDWLEWLLWFWFYDTQLKTVPYI